MGVSLWRDLSDDHQRTLSRGFLNFSPAELTELTEDDFYLFAQWIYGREHRQMATSFVVCTGGADFTYEFADGSREFLRVYPNERVPVVWLHDVLETVKREKYKKIRIYMRAEKGKAAKNLQGEFPLILEVVDIEGLHHRLVDEQRRFQKTRFEKELNRAQTKIGKANPLLFLIGKIKSSLLRRG